MKDFLLSYFREIIVLFCFLVELCLSLVILIKKQKKQSGVVGVIISNLPDIINYVEKKLGPKSGISKKTQALDLALENYRSMTGISLTYDSALAKIFSKAIEDILSTPQKKEH